MRRFFFISYAFLLFFANGVAFANINSCIALVNHSKIAVEFDGLVSPGYTLTVKPHESKTLTGDQIGGSCIAGDNDCIVDVSWRDENGNIDSDLIEHLPQSAQIIFSGPHQYSIIPLNVIACD